MMAAAVVLLTFSEPNLLQHADLGPGWGRGVAGREMKGQRLQNQTRKTPHWQDLLEDTSHESYR